MRLIDVETMEFKEFYGEEMPPYAILSHTWGDSEVSYQEFQHPDIASRKTGYTKIVGACRQAKVDGLQYVWVDTNCIDKTSSAELTEAINSMYAWYHKAKICYAYLVDVSEQDIQSTASPHTQDDHVRDWSRFQSSRWFTRGWTLQELIAPTQVNFYASNWRLIGDRHSLSKEISKATGISLRYLPESHVLSTDASAATKMSWLSRRKTTRVEDMAYCMLGIFEINMPLLYGEGTKAFTRLQEEIIRSSSDQTIFCWNWSDLVPSSWSSMLAPFPQVFESAGIYEDHSGMEDPRPYTMTNFGLLIEAPLYQCWGCDFMTLNVVLGSDRYADREDHRVCIPVAPNFRYRGMFARASFPSTPISICRVDWMSDKRCSRKIHIGHRRMVHRLPDRVDPEVALRSMGYRLGDDLDKSKRSSDDHLYGFLLVIDWSTGLFSDTAHSSDNDYWSNAMKRRPPWRGRNQATVLPPGEPDTNFGIVWLDPKGHGSKTVIKLVGDGEIELFLYLELRRSADKELLWFCYCFGPNRNTTWPDSAVEKQDLLGKLGRKFRPLTIGGFEWDGLCGTYAMACGQTHSNPRYTLQTVLLFNI